MNGFECFYAIVTDMGHGHRQWVIGHSSDGSLGHGSLSLTCSAQQYAWAPEANVDWYGEILPSPLFPCPLNILNIFTEIIGMAPPINVQDWYGDRHTCQIASGALDNTYTRQLNASA